jgi:hypothetical protein
MRQRQQKHRRKSSDMNSAVEIKTMHYLFRSVDDEVAALVVRALAHLLEVVSASSLQAADARLEHNRHRANRDLFLKGTKTCED